MRRLSGYALCGLALAALAWDVWRGPMAGAPLELTSVAEFWAAADRGSLVAFGAMIEERISISAWQDAALPALLWPAAASLGGLGLFLHLVAPRRG